MYTDFCFLEAHLRKALTWSLTSVAVCVTAGRIYIRPKYTHLFWDDLFSGLAALCLIVYEPLGNPGVGNDPSSALAWQASLASDMLLWTILYLVKASFLVLCWFIFSISTKFRLAWWIISMYTFLTYWPLLLGEVWQCGSPAEYSDPVACNAYSYSEGFPKYIIEGSSIATALHISSDLLILALPLVFIRSLQMSKVQRFNAGAVFALVLIDIAMGLTRNVLAATTGPDEENNYRSLNNVLSIFEPSLAVIVCALPAYKALSLAQRKRERFRNGEAQRHQGQPTPDRRPPQMVLDDSIAELERP